MEFVIQESKKSKLQADLLGADHTVCNLLMNEVQSDKSVLAAAYNIDHPIVGKPKLIVDTDGKDPKAALVDACKRLKKINQEMLKSIDKA